LALALVPVFVLLFLGVDALKNWAEADGPAAWLSTLVLFVAAWIGQFIGHAIEGRKPSFLQDLQFLLIGPIWLMGKAFQRAGWRY
ncbi:MAG: Mpo1-like protein, partial [Gammaproteobacteria bacterium]